LDVRKVVFPDLLALAVELVRKALDKEHSENKFLELRGIHFAAQNIGRLE